MIEALFELGYTVLGPAFAVGAGIAVALIVAVLFLAMLTELIERIL